MNTESQIYTFKNYLDDTPENRGKKLQEKMLEFCTSLNVKRKDNTSWNPIRAAFGHNKTYINKEVETFKREEFKTRLLEELKEISNRIKTNNKYKESEHYEEIKALSSRISDEFGNILFDGKFKIGTSQKALNLYLKFQWCLGGGYPKPIHCPIDRIILKKAKLKGAWTKCDSIEDYKAWIDDVKKFVGSDDISTWELFAWDNK